METVKVYLDDTRNASIVCGSCGKSKEVNFSEREPPRSGVVKCGCGNSFVVSFEKRQNYRKQVEIWGVCFASSDSTKGEPVKILDISSTGLKFQKTTDNGLKPNQRLKVVFKLREQTLNLTVAVRHVRSGSVGAEIVDIDQHSRKTIGFFLMA